MDGIDAAAINPLLARIPPELKARGMEVTMPHFRRRAAHATTRTPGAQNYLRIMLRAREQQSAAEKSQLIEQVTARRATSLSPPATRQPGAK